MSSLYNPLININPENIDIFNQSITLCWLQSVIVSIFLSDGLREYMFHNVFNLITTKEENTKFPYSSKYPLKLPTHNILHNEDYKIIRNYIYIVIEIIRKTLIYSNEEISDICDYALQKLICESDDIVKRLFGCADICMGGYNNKFINLLNEYYNLKLVSVLYDLNSNINIVNEVTINKKNPLSLILFLKKPGAAMSHMISIIKINNIYYLYDNESKKFIDEKNNITKCLNSEKEILTLYEVLNECLNTHLKNYIETGYVISSINLITIDEKEIEKIIINPLLHSKENIFNNLIETKENEIINGNKKLIENIPQDERNIFYELIDELTRNKLYKILFPNVKEYISSIVLKGGKKKLKVLKNKKTRKNKKPKKIIK